MAWDPSYEIGQPHIDAQHRLLMNLINELAEAMRTRITVERLSRLLHEIKKYAEFHFTSEENYMHAISYPRRFQHEKVHSAMLSELSVRIMKARQEWRHVREVHEFLVNWLIHHVAIEDKLIADHARRMEELGLLASPR